MYGHVGRVLNNGADQMEQVAKFATCKRCGNNRVAWVKSYKTGKAYLVNARQDDVDGVIVADRRDFHNCPNRQARPASASQATSSSADLATQIEGLTALVGALSARVQELEARAWDGEKVR
jgi:hypothetical protein